MTGGDWWMRLVVPRLGELDDRVVFTAGLVSVNLVVFYGLNALLSLCYRHELFPQYRINGGKMPDQELVQSCVRHNALNNLLVQPLAAYFVAYPLFVRGGMLIRAPLPPLRTVVAHLLFALLLNDTLFYWAHRALHHPALYKHIHKQHHQFRESIGIAATYAHPVEDLLAAVVPTLCGCALLGSHFAVLLLWIALRLAETVEAHSGYAFPLPWHRLPFCNNVERHDFHHSHNTGCYGSLELWDALCGTDKTFLEYQRKKREARDKCE